MGSPFRAGCLAIISMLATAEAATVYRYQDESGRWHFSDKQPKRAHEKLEVVQAAPKHLQPELRFHQQTGQQRLMALNPLYAPVQFELLDQGQRISQWVVEPRSESPVLINGEPITQWQSGFEYRMRLGRPISRSDGQPLRPPVPTAGKFLITQAFHGSYSHSQEPNTYSVDISMPVGETIHAARDGVVVAVKDDYHMGGSNSYFLDKANRIEVLHSDGTLGVYAHILLGSAVVKEGQRVLTGEALAGAGSSGYSTGPHLHFGLRANDGERSVSLPFKFKQGDRIFEPRDKQWLRAE